MFVDCCFQNYISAYMSKILGDRKIVTPKKDRYSKIGAKIYCLYGPT